MTSYLVRKAESCDSTSQSIHLLTSCQYVSNNLDRTDQQTKATNEHSGGLSCHWLGHSYTIVVVAVTFLSVKQK